MQLPVVTQQNFFLQYDPSWNQLQLNNIIVPVTTAANPVRVFLPPISSFKNLHEFTISVIRFASSGTSNPITIIPALGETIGGGGFVSMVNLTFESFVLAPEGDNNWSCLTTQNISLLKIAGFSSGAFTSAAGFPIGTRFAISDYNSTTQGMTVRRFQRRYNDRRDWIVTATTAKDSTGTIGTNPLP